MPIEKTKQKETAFSEKFTLVSEIINRNKRI